MPFQQEDRLPTLSWPAACRFVLKLARPWHRYAFGSVFANALSALFEGATICSLAIALQVLGNPQGASPGNLPTFLKVHLDLFRTNLGQDGLFLCLILLAVLAQILRSLFQFAGYAAAAQLRTCVQAQAHHLSFSRILHLPFSKVSAYRLGDLTDSFNQTGRLHEFFGSLNDLVRNGLFVAIYGVVLLWISWPMTLAAVTVYWAMTRFLYQIVTRVRKHADRFTAASVRLSEQATEFIQSIRLLHTFARQEETIHDMHKLSQQGMRSRRNATILSNAMEPVTDVITVLATSFFLLIGYWILDPSGLLRLPHLLIFLIALHRVAPRLRSVFSSIAWLVALTPSIGRFQRILQQPEELEDPDHTRPFHGFQQAIEFRHVAMRYHPEEPYAVSDLSFKIPRGSFIALVGPSGTGKSTVADLLLRLYEPTSGQILVDGTPLSTTQRAAWRARIGVVSQEAFLFHASVRENILFGKPDATEEELLAAARWAHADAFIGRLSEGFDTVVGDRGVRLSGGQCQRIALARALIRQPDLLILDEATSALDSESEQIIQQAMDEQRGHRTLFVIAHRLSTIARADQILVLAGGRLVEQGTHQQLLSLGGTYSRLWQLQSQGDREPVTSFVEANQ